MRSSTRWVRSSDDGDAAACDPAAGDQGDDDPRRPRDRRFGSVSLPLDEALIEVALDLSGRPFLHYEIETAPEPLGTPPFDPQLAEEFWRAFATAAALTLHLRMRSGKNPHHVLEASFKGV